MKHPSDPTTQPPEAHRLLRSLSPDQRAALLRKLGRQPLSGSALVAEGLRQCGVRHLCGIGGTPVDSIFGEAAKRGIRPISPRHQTTATLIAASANYLSGALENAVLVSAGPALTNTMTGILVARDNHWPLLVMGGRRALRGEGSGYFQELDAVPMMRPVTKWAATVRSAGDVISTVHEAVERSISGSPGPVYLDLPEDVLSEAATPGDLPAPVRRPAAAPPDEDVARAYALLREAARPLLCLGEEIRWDVDLEALRRLIEREQLPFITTSLARGFLPDDHPLCFNLVRHRVPSRCDLAIMAGAWFDWRFRLGVELGPQTSVIHADANDETRGRNVDATLAIPGDAAMFLNALSARSRREEPVSRAGWLGELDVLRAEECSRQATWRAQRGEPMFPQEIYDALIESLPDDAFVILDGSIHLACGQHLMRVRRPLSWLDPTWSGIIGAGIPFGLGARLSFPDRPIVVVVGDTGFGLSGMELETAARNDLPFLLIIVNNNGVNGQVRQESVLGSPHANPFYVFSPELRYDVVARGLGTRNAAWIASAVDLRSAVAESLNHGGLTCLNVRVNPHAPIPPVW